MDGYPASYVAQSRPLLVLSGWSRPKTSDAAAKPGNGPRIRSDLPPVSGARSQELQEAFLSFDLDQARKGPDRSNTYQSPLMQFRLRSCGRQYIFPARKASPSASEVGSQAAPGSTSLHSPLSPLSRGSPVYVDGIMTPLWSLKYHEFVPSILLLFFSIAFDPQNDVLRDNHLKSEINAIKNQIAESNYRTKVAVVLIAEDSMRRTFDVEERLGNIRKTTKLDSKSTFFYLPPEASTSDFSTFAESVLSSLRPVCLEFYKTQYKHSRRKKDRKGDSNPSSPTVEGISQSLPKSGWNVRYEYKMALLSEFRSEMETAARHYKDVTDLLLGPAGLFDLYSSWSPRWNEMRLLADTVALRRIRCLLACGLPSVAAKFWIIYREMTRNLLNRKGKGSSTYGWQAWESRLAECMAELIQAGFTQITDSSSRKVIDVLSRKQRYPYAPADKISLPNALSPWSFLHHPGYWFYFSARHSEARNALAMAIPEEDLIPPGQSPATRVARRSESYDTYLCPEPHLEGNIFDHKQDVLGRLEIAVTEFSARDQVWMADRLRFTIAEKVAQGSTSDPSVLQKFWRGHRWRPYGWGSLTRKIAHELWLLSVQANDFQTQILTTWELLDSRLDKNKAALYDLERLCQRISDSISHADTPIEIRIREEETSSFLDLDFIFEKESENLGETLRAQAIIYSNAHSGSAPVQLSEISITIQGDLSNIRIINSPDAQTESVQSGICEVALRESSEDANTLVGEASLTIYPRQTRVFALNFTLRESGKLRASTAMAIIEKPSLRIEYSKTFSEGGGDVRWHVRGDAGLSRQRRFGWSSFREVTVLPKLPKLKIRLPNLADKYYVGELAVIDVELTNDESWDIEGSLEVRIPGDRPEISQPTILETPIAEGSGTASEKGEPACRFGTIAHGGSERRQIAIRIPSHPPDDISLEIEAQYNGARESDNIVSKTTSAKLVVVEPVTATFNLSANFHPDPWPSFFTLADLLQPPYGPGKTTPAGLSSRWNLQVNVLCLADDVLSLDNVGLSLVERGEGCTSTVIPASNTQTTLTRGESQEVNFTIDVTKENLEDATPPAFDPTLTIHWRRASSTGTPYFEKVLAAPPLSLPTNEPRVIATRAASDNDTVLIDIHLENPSMHYLTFELGIEANDDFAFSGPKLGVVHLVPMSRHSIRFVLMPLVRGAFIQVTFKAVDVYFNKSLRVNAGTGLRRDGNGSLLIWIDSEI